MVPYLSKHLLIYPLFKFFQNIGLFINNETACINSKLLDFLHQIGKQLENADYPRAIFFDTLKAHISLSPPAIAL